MEVHTSGAERTLLHEIITLLSAALSVVTGVFHQSSQTLYLQLKMLFDCE